MRIVKGVSMITFHGVTKDYDGPLPQPLIWPSKMGVPSDWLATWSLGGKSTTISRVITSFQLAPTVRIPIANGLRSKRRSVAAIRRIFLASHSHGILELVTPSYVDKSLQLIVISCWEPIFDFIHQEVRLNPFQACGMRQKVLLRSALIRSRYLVWMRWEALFYDLKQMMCQHAWSQRKTVISPTALKWPNNPVIRSLFRAISFSMWTIEGQHPEQPGR